MQDNYNRDPFDPNRPETDGHTSEPYVSEETQGVNFTMRDSYEENSAEPENPDYVSYQEPQNFRDYQEDSYTQQQTYSRQDDPQEEDIPRWQPYQEYQQGPQQTPPPKKPKKKRWIPLVIVLVILVAALVTGAVFGAQQLGRMVSAETSIQDNGTVNSTTPIASTNTSSGNMVSTGDIYLIDVSNVVQEVMPAVVSITSRSLVESGGYGDYWNYIFGRGGSQSGNTQSQEVESGIGSGTIISENSKELLVLTSYHVVEGSSSLYVTFNDGTSVDGYIKSQSEDTDIAIVAVPITDIPAETLANIKIAQLSFEPAKVGEGAIVIGNALGYGMSVTTGIISATDRQITVNGKKLNVMQTDAAINSGNSGGCVLNSKGEVIGISEAKITNSSVEGMCYAIPISSNTELIQTLLNQEGSNSNSDNQQASGQGAYLGIRGSDVDKSAAARYGMPQGVYIAKTIAGGGAEAAGVKEGDIIVGLDNVSLSTMSELQAQLKKYDPGDQVTLIIMREENGSYTQVNLSVTLTEMIS